MFKKLIAGIKSAFATDPEDMEVEELVALVLDRNSAEDRRRAGAEALGGLSDVIGDMDDAHKGPISERAYSQLVQLLERSDEPDWVIAGAISGMNEIVNVGRYDMNVATIEASVEPLIAQLQGQRGAETRSAACGALSSVDDVISDEPALRSMNAVAEIMRSSSGELRASAIFSLGCFDSERSGGLWDEVAAHLDDASPEVRSSTASALWMIGNEAPRAEVVDRLVTMLGTETGKRMRSSITDALGHLGKGHPAVVPALAKALESEETRHMAIFALSELGAEADPAVPKLSVLLGDEDHEDSAVMALQEIGTPSARAALEAAGHPAED